MWSASEREESCWRPSLYDDTEGKGLAYVARGMAGEVTKDMWRVACGAGAVKAETVANRATNNAAWVLSLLALEQVLYHWPS